MRHGLWKDAIKKVSCGILSTASDLVLLHAFLLLEGMGGVGYSQRSVRVTFEKALNDLDAFTSGVPATSIKHLTLRGWIKRASRDLRNWHITASGRKRIASLFPMYRRHRPWDKKMYIITYDVPERAHWKRDVLREQLRKLGCGMIQASVWITPSYPRKILREMIDEYRIPGSILVSDLGINGSIGEQSLTDLVREVYQIDALEQEYAQFIEQCKKGIYKHPVTIHCAFTCILAHDPQLPFALLPQPWIGSTAHEYYRTTVRSILRKNHQR